MYFSTSSVFTTFQFSNWRRVTVSVEAGRFGSSAGRAVPPPAGEAALTLTVGSTATGSSGEGVVPDVGPACLRAASGTAAAVLSAWAGWISRGREKGSRPSAMARARGRARTCAARDR